MFVILLLLLLRAFCVLCAINHPQFLSLYHDLNQVTSEDYGFFDVETANSVMETVIQSVTVMDHDTQMNYSLKPKRQTKDIETTEIGHFKFNLAKIVRRYCFCCIPDRAFDLLCFLCFLIHCCLLSIPYRLLKIMLSTTASNPQQSV